MARHKGETFPSDHRRWFRVREDILDDEKLSKVSAEVFRFYFRLLAMLNRTKSKNGKLRLDRFALNACAMREQRRHSLSTARAGAAAGLYRMSEDGLDTLFTVRKWPETQYPAPKEPRASPEKTPATKTTPKTKTTPNNRTDADAPDSPAARARDVWPRLVGRAKRHGARWSPKPGPKQVEIVAARIADGATDETLERAVEGYIRKNGTEPRDGFDPMKHFTATTLFRASKFDANVEGSYLPEPTRKPTPGTPSGPTPKQLAARERLAEAKRARNDPEAVGNIIDMSMRQAKGSA